MKRTTLFVALAVVVGTLLVPVAGVMAQEDRTEDSDEVAPGERLSGVVGVQSAEFDGEIERNAFRIGLERADDNATKARQIAEKLNQSEERLTELKERKAELQEQRASDNITEGQYRARMARLSTETKTVEQQLNQSNATAGELPAETLKQNGVNVTAIETLRANASELSGQEVAEIARSIAGDRSGMVERGPPSDRGGAGNATDDRPGGQAGDGENATDGESAGEQQADGSDRPTADDEETDGSETEGSDSDGAGTDGSDAGSGGADGSGSDNGGAPSDD
jgi:hypothetical protein